MRFLLKKIDSSLLEEYNLKDECELNALEDLSSFDNNEIFVFHPFHIASNPILCATIESIKQVQNTKTYSIEKATLEKLSGKSIFENLVKNAQKSILENKFEKVVLSRVLEVSLNNLMNPDETLGNVMKEFPNTANYLFEHENECWIGATPEQLISCKNGKFQIISLAGTISKENRKTTNWTAKEIEEQQIVTSYIQEKIKNIGIETEISETSEVFTGNLYHLKTKISGRLKNSDELVELIEQLHPTPAVCGTPKQNAQSFILENENYRREYYTGFFGTIDFKNLNCDLYVNLRCLKSVGEKVSIFAGAGITKDSSPEKEYLETQAKIGTLKRLFKF